MVNNFVSVLKTNKARGRRRMSETVLSELVGAAAAPIARARIMEENFIFESRG